jgi:hypothetical protein
MSVQHTFDFVTTPIRANSRLVTLQLLHPSIGPQIQAERYGFLAYDIAETSAGEWPRVAVVAKSEDWPSRALQLVQSISQATILLETDHEARIETVLPRKMN